MPVWTVVYLKFQRHDVGCYRYSQIIVNAVYSLLVFCVLDVRPLLLVGFFKLVAALVLACMLAFVVVHSSNICRLITACLGVLPVSYFPLAVDRRGVEQSQTTVAIPNEPSLSPLFQRPPPILAL